MEFDFGEVSAATRYKLLVSFVVPRPIALISTKNSAGQGNAAPMSFFNVFSEDPPIVIVGLQNRPQGHPKDTARNIKDTGEFVVNLVNEPMAERMVDCSINFPPEIDEIEAAGFTPLRSDVVNPDRIAEAPAALECRLERVIEYPNRSVIFGEVVYMHIQDEFIDPQTLYVRAPHYAAVARLHADFYLTAGDQYELPRSSHEEWLCRRADGNLKATTER